MWERGTPRWDCEKGDEGVSSRASGVREDWRATHGAEVDDGTGVFVWCDDGRSDHRFHHLGDLEHLARIRKVGRIVDDSLGAILVLDCEGVGGK